MKNLSLFLVLLFVFPAVADDELKCLNFANKESRPSIEASQVGILCNGAVTKLSPVICFREAYRLPRQNLGKENAAVLCSAGLPRSANFNSIDCYYRALAAMGNNQKIAAVTVCSRATDYGPLKCASEVKESRGLKMDWESAAALCTQGFVGRKKEDCPDNLTHL